MAYPEMIDAPAMEPVAEPERVPSDLELFEKAIMRTRELLADSGLDESDPKAKNLFKKVAETMIAGKAGSQSIRLADTV